MEGMMALSETHLHDLRRYLVVVIPHQIHRGKQSTCVF